MRWTACNLPGTCDRPGESGSMDRFIDTSIFVDVLRSNAVDSSASLLKEAGKENGAFASVITVAELSVGAYRSPRRNAMENTHKLLSTAHIVALSQDIAIHGGRIYAGLVKKGEKIELHDCLIAASSLSLDIESVVTRDIEHFSRIDRVKAVTPEDLGF